MTRAAPSDPPTEDYLSGQDAAFLGWESRRRPMHVGVLATFRVAPGGVVPSIEALRSTLGPRVAREPRFLHRLVRRGWRRRPVFVPAEGVRLEEHIHAGPTPAASGPASLPALVDRIVSGPLDPSRPLWQFWLLPHAEGPGTYAIVAKVHHCLLDGIAGVGVLERLLGGGPVPVEEPRPHRAASSPSRRGGLVRQARAFGRLMGRVLAPGPRTGLTGDVTPRRHHSWLAADHGALAAAGDRNAATHNDALLAAVSGALRRWLAREPGELPDSVRAFCPVSLRDPSERRGTGNHLSLWLVDLPVGVRDPAERIARIEQSTRRHKRRRDSGGGAGMARLSELLGVWVSKLGMALAARRRAFSVLVTNIPGPTRPLHLLGARLERLVPFAPLLPGQRVAVAAVSYAGSLQCGVSDGWRQRREGEVFAAALQLSLQEVCVSPAVELSAPLFAPPAFDPPALVVGRRAEAV